jgi:hypothetical protein
MRLKALTSQARRSNGRVLFYLHKKHLAAHNVIDRMAT